MLYELGLAGTSTPLTCTVPRLIDPHCWCLCSRVSQAFASVTSLFTQLEKIVELALEVDYPTPVTDALLEVLYGASPYPCFPEDDVRAR